MSIPPITYGKRKYCEDEGNNTIVHSYENISMVDFDSYVSRLLCEGYKTVNQYTMSPENKVIHFRKGNDAVYTVFYSAMN